MRPQRQFIFPDVSLGGCVVAESHLGREQMIITGERQGDNSACVLGGAISYFESFFFRRKVWLSSTQPFSDVHLFQMFCYQCY